MCALKRSGKEWLFFMKILKLNAYYFPEKTASTHLHADLNESFEKNKIDTTIITPIPTRGVDNNIKQKYKKILDEVTNNGYVRIKRFNLMAECKNPLFRAIRYFLMNIKEYRIAIKEKNVDAIFCSSTPPTQGVLSVFVSRSLRNQYQHKVPFIYNLQDIFPDSLVVAGYTKKNSLLWKIGRKIEDFTYKNADKIIVISEGFKKNIMNKGVPEEKIEIISNWIDIDSVYPVERKNNRLIDELGLDQSKFIVVYAGNFGAAQGADIVIKAAKKLRQNENIQFVIFGGGAYFDEAKKESENLDNVVVHTLMPQNRISEVYSLGDIALITCKKGTGAAGMPSKLWSIMACNTPIIASFDKDSDLADAIRNSGAGICVEPENVFALVSAIEKACKLKENDSNFTDLRNYVSTYASKQVCVVKYIQLIKDCIQNVREISV